MVLPQPGGSPHTHRPSIVLAMAAQRGSCLAGEGTNCSLREKRPNLANRSGILRSRENATSVEVKGEGIQEKEKWMGKRTNYMIDTAFPVPMSIQMSSPASCQIDSN